MADSVTETIRAAAKSLGYPEIHHLQETAVRAFVAGSDIFLSLPTSRGKSLCYAMLPLIIDKLWGNDTQQLLVIFVSPLVALMKDQVSALTHRNVSAV